MCPDCVTELPWIDPWTALSAWKDAPWLAFLDSGGAPDGERSRWSFLCVNPQETLVVRGDHIRRNGQSVAGDAWEHLRDMQRRLPDKGKTGLPFAGGLVGLASYGAGMTLETVQSRHHTKTPDLIAASYDAVLAFDRYEKRCFRVGNFSMPSTMKPVRASAPNRAFQPDMSREEWIAAVREIIRLIGEGDIFQANLTLRWHAEVPPPFDELATYAALRQGSPAPFGAYLRCAGEVPFSLMSASVERFLSLSPDGVVETRPIKGTAQAGNTTEEDARFAEALGRDAKENAENLMITDLMRNDIGRVCEVGSVSVPQLCAVERFAHVHHLVSCVRGKLRDGLDAIDLLRATLPPGSVTGAPKKRAMEIIDHIERSARGAYCGSVFRIGRDGAMDSSVVIRSVERCGNRLTIGTGGGITWPSDPEREYDEMRLKVAALLGVFGA
ncbi:anthranilate synthase component I family protein [Acetobacter sp. LMG 1627]|uniref:Anthranilate synthase component I family protein n=2 Tax=Acetobacter conturbans TaxID=1737472 RepID=A0ABX0K3M3_9PROT|nr:anthranilate synthase component I family protein [Acetobacter conturbans]